MCIESTKEIKKICFECKYCEFKGDVDENLEKCPNCGEPSKIKIHKMFRDLNGTKKLYGDSA